MFRRTNTNLASVQKHGHKYELILLFTCFVSLVPPPAFLVSILICPIDPFRTLLVIGAEMEIELTLPIFCLCLLYSWSALAMTNTFITFIIPGIITLASCHTWTAATMPESCISKTQFETSDLGQQHCDQIIKVYRYNQVICNYINALIGNFKIALHFTLLYILFILASFILIKNGALFLDQGAYDMIGILVVVGSLVLFIAKMECFFIGTMVDTADSERKVFKFGESENVCV